MTSAISLLEAVLWVGGTIFGSLIVGLVIVLVSEKLAEMFIP